jgi:hypothetical protein
MAEIFMVRPVDDERIYSLNDEPQVSCGEAIFSFAKPDRCGKLRHEFLACRVSLKDVPA